MRKIAVQDANILIDLIKAGVITHCMQLDYAFITTSLVLDEIDDDQKTFLQPFIANQRLEVIFPGEEDLGIIQALAAENSRLSEQDLSVYLLAQNSNAILLTGDNILRKFAEKQQVEVYGMLWILDNLVQAAIICGSLATVYLQACIDNKSRLPADECKKRFDKWGT